MKICLLANAMSVHTQRWALAYAAKGHDVCLLSIRNIDLPAINIIPVYLGPQNSKSKFWTFCSYLYLLLTIRRHLRRLRPDILHAHFVPTHGVIAAYSKFHPLVLSVWGSDVIWHKSSNMPLIRRMMIRYALKRADEITATSQFLVERTKEFTSSDRQIRHIPFGIDCQIFIPPTTDSEHRDDLCFRIGFVKKLSSIYGPDILIRAFYLILKEIPQARLIMAGRKDQKPQLQRLAQDLKVADKIEFLGPVPHEHIHELLNTFDVFVNPSVCQESFGVSVLEASACGLAVVATRVGGVPEVCIDEQTGLLVTPADPNALAQAIIKLARDDSRRRQLGHAAREFVLARYQWHENVEEMIQLFIQLVRNQSAKLK